MKRNLLICQTTLFVLFLPFENLYAQDQQPDSLNLVIRSQVAMQTNTASSSSSSGEDSYYPQVIPPSPQSAIYQKYLNHKISECTGIPDISIPLYEIKLKDMTIPVTLSYHASGVQAHQYDGDVGAGWSINVGGFRVMRTIYGNPDEIVFYPHYSDEGIESHCDNINEFSSYLDRSIKDEHLRFLHDNMDTEYDHFSYILPSSSGDFIIQKERNADLFKTLIAGPQQDIFTFEDANDHSFRNFSITDEQGTIYRLGGNFTEWTLDFSTNMSQYMVGWPLHKMTTRHKEVVNFEYKGSGGYLNDRAVNSITYTEAPFYTNYIPYSNYPDGKWLTGSTVPYVYYSDYRGSWSLINKITTPYCKIVFVRKGSSPNAHASWFQLITAIEIYNTNNELIKKINFDYDLATGNGNSMHNLLTSIAISGGQQTTQQEKYLFAYYGSTYQSIDQWGYGHGKYEDGGKKNYFHSGFKTYPPLLSVKSGGIARDVYMSFRALVSSDIDYYDIYFDDRSVKDVPATDYSLKCIVFPTGGFTEYEYEPHRDDHGRKIGGLRIKKIISKPSSTANSIITEFQYADARFDVLLDEMDFVDELYTMIFGTGSGGWIVVDFGREGWFEPSMIYTCSRTLQFRTHPVGSLLDYKAHYGMVTTLQYDQNMEVYNGKTVSIYGNIPPSGKQRLPEMARITPENVNIGPGPGWMTNMPEGRYSFGRNFWIDSYKGYSPTLTSRTYYDNKDQIKKREEYTYTNVQKGSFRELRIKERIKVHNSANIGYGGSVTMGVYNFITSRYDYREYELKLGFHRLDSKRTLDYTESGEVFLDETYSYNKNHRLIRKTSGSLSESYRYPEDFTESVYRNMVAANILSPIIEKTKYSGIYSFPSTEINRTKINYENRSGIYLPTSIQSRTPSVDYRTEISFDRHDTKGNVLQCTDLKGIPVVYLWGYEGQYPIAEIRNANYNQLAAIINESTLNAISAKFQPTTSDWTLINSLRTNPALSNALITTYTYKPLAGMPAMLTVTDPAGFVTYYDYDSLDRLIRIKDNNASIVEEYGYHLPNTLIQ